MGLGGTIFDYYNTEAALIQHGYDLTSLEFSTPFDTDIHMQIVIKRLKDETERANAQAMKTPRR